MSSIIFPVAIVPISRDHFEYSIALSHVTEELALIPTAILVEIDSISMNFIINPSSYILLAIGVTKLAPSLFNIFLDDLPSKFISIRELYDFRPLNFIFKGFVDDFILFMNVKIPLR